MKTLARVLASLAAAMSSLFFFRVRSPAGAPLTLPKMITASLSPLVAVMGGLGAVLGLLTRTPSAVFAGGLGAILATCYVQRATASHAGFEHAFGADWRIFCRDFRRHPRMIGAMFRVAGLPAKPSRAGTLLRPTV